MNSLPLLIMNTTIMTNDGVYSLKTISLEEAKAIVSNNEICSGIGHSATAQIMTTILGIEIPENRVMLAQQPGQAALCFKLNGRPAEGAILGIDEIEAIGYSFKLMERLE